MRTRDEVINRIKSGNFSNGYGFDLQILVNVVGTLGEMLRNGYTIAQPPRVMTLDEVRAAEVVWLEQCGKCVCAIKIRTYANGIISFAYAYNNRVDIINIKPNLYGEICRCWTSRPTDEQREAVKWG